MSSDVEVEDKVLYDLSVHNEWVQEPEKVFRHRENRVTLPRRLASISSRTAWTAFRAIGIGSGTEFPCLLPPGLVKLINGSMSWHVAVTQDGACVAVLQDTDLEVRSIYDEFASVAARTSVLSRRDAYPQWRHLAWSEQSDLLACSDSVGNVYVYDTMCTPVCTIPCGWSPGPNEPADLSRAVCALIFTQPKTNACLAELWVINYQGTLKKYAISENGQAQLMHSFSFSQHYPQGISSVIYQYKYDVLLIGGCGDMDSMPSSGDDVKCDDALRCGVSAWRVLSGAPHYKLVTDLEQDQELANRNKYRAFRRIKSMTSLGWWHGKEQDGIYCMRLNPSGDTLSTIHYSGRFSLWHVPSLKLKKSWPLDQQPGYNEINQSIAENPKKRRMMKEHLQSFWLTDTNWWSDQAVILARGTGAVSVSNITSLKNLLGACEWFEPAPRLTHTTTTGFLSLEVESKYQSLKRHVSGNSEGSGSEDDMEPDTEDEDDLDLISRSTRYIKYSLYYVTDIERFQPPRKKPKLVTRTYRLLCLKSTTPEELYARKIDNEEYGEALMLAKSYGLDCDLVYQRQWRKTPVSVASIQDYLSKISKRAWVLHECLERVPENIDAMRELLQYALRGTDVEALLAIGRGEDQGRFVMCDNAAAYEESIESFSEQSAEELKKKEKENQERLLKEVDFENFSLEQRELCRARKKLLQYLDRLSTYEEILGGIYVAADRYMGNFFEDFRSKNIVELAVNYARKCDWRALDTLFFYHGDELLPHRLAILANFPETFSPSEYHDLLPEAELNSSLVVPVRQGKWREPDWVERDDVKQYVDPTSIDYGAFLYEENPDYANFSGIVTAPMLTQWYIQRAMEIEYFARQVDHALEIITLGREKNVQGLEGLQSNLVTMETLVYECHVEESLTLTDVQTMPNIDKLRLMMMRSSEEMFVKNVRRWLVPFLQRLETTEPGCYDELLREYLVTMARTDLTLCLKMFEASKSHLQNPVIGSEQLLIELALECIYACEANDQLSNAFGILECLPQRAYGMGSGEMDALHNRVDELECHLSAGEILDKHELPQTVAFIRHTQDSEEETRKLLTKLTRVAGRRDPAPCEEDWRELLKDILLLRDKGFKALQPSDCYEIFVESLLTSGRLADIELAGKLLESSAHEAREPDYQQLECRDYGGFEKVAYPRAVELVLSAAREYFDASANLADSNMDLARSCLDLIGDKPRAISEELDLIDGLKLLDGFGVRILPLQVRMCKDRTQLIQQALEAKPYTYRNPQRILKLGTLLNIGGNNVIEREGQVMRLVIQSALRNGDHSIAYSTCYRMVQIGYGPAWHECKALAELEKFTDIRAKVKLLSFAVTHCDPEMIESILRAKCLLQAQVNMDILEAECAGRDSQSPPPSSALTASGALSQTHAILSSTNKVTKSVLSTVSDRQWWNKTLSRMRPKTSDDMELLHHGNKSFTKTGCHPFYTDIIGEGYESKREVDYAALRMPRLDAGTVCTSEGMLRTHKLQETVSEGEHFQPATQVLLQLAQDTLTEDTTLGLAYLLALPKAQEADKCFEDCGKTGVSLELITYYYALQIYDHLRAERPAKPHIDPVYLHSPEEVTRRVLKLVNKGHVKGDNDIEELVTRLKTSEEKLLDYTQAHSLKELGKGVDVVRFSEDNVYKKETILGLAMSADQAMYEMAVSLARRNDMDLWEVYMTHLEFLFESGLTVEDLEKRVRVLDILSTLQERPADFIDRLKRSVWPFLDGQDHAMLMYYYTLLDGCKTKEEVKKVTKTKSSEKDIESGDNPQTHIKLLKKIVSIASDLDYKRLTDPNENALDVIRPVLNPSNVSQIAKIAGKIPTSDGSTLQPSVVYCAWALKQFWEGVSTSGKKAAPATPQTQADWVHRYESCHEFINKLGPDDFTQFIDNILFQEKSLEMLNLETRQEIAKRSVKFCKQQQSKNKLEPQPWIDACTKIQQAQEHLSLMTSPFLLELRNSKDAQNKRYAKLFEMTRSKEDKVKNLLITVALDGQSMEFIDSLLQASPLENLQTASVVRDAISLVTSAFRGPEEKSKLLENRDELSALKAVIGQVSKHIENWGELVELEDVMSQLRPFCADPEVPVETRLDVLKILETCFQLDDADTGLLLLYRTDAIVTSYWPEITVKETNVESDETRQQFFETLLQDSQSSDQIESLAQLLQVWPPLQAITSQSEDPHKNPVYKLLERSVRQVPESGNNTAYSICKKLKEVFALPEKCVSHIWELFVDVDELILGVKAALLFNYPAVHEKVVDSLKQFDKASEDEELIQLLLQRHLLSNLVSTCYYAPCVIYVLEHQVDTAEQTPYYLQVENLAYQLSEDGYKAEAGSLLAQYRGMHPMLSTFDSAFSVVSRWLTKSGP